MNWRTDIENAPKTRSIFMFDGDVRVVEWGDLSIMYSGTSAFEYNGEPIQYDWVTVGSNCYKTDQFGNVRLRENMNNPTHWCEIVLPTKKEEDEE